MDCGSHAHQSINIIRPCSTHRPRNPPSSMVRSAVGLLSWCGFSPLVKWACGPFVDEGDGRAKRHAFLFDEPNGGHEGDRLMTCAHGLGGPCYGKKVSSRLRIRSSVHHGVDAHRAQPLHEPYGKPTVRKPNSLARAGPLIPHRPFLPRQSPGAKGERSL